MLTGPVAGRPWLVAAVFFAVLLLAFAGWSPSARATLAPALHLTGDSHAAALSKAADQSDGGSTHIAKLYDSGSGPINYTYSYCSSSTINEDMLAHDWKPADAPNKYFVPGTTHPPGISYTRGLIMARTSTEDVSWIEENNLEVRPYVYVVDNDTAPLHTPLNKGNEVMAYLTYIIDNYDDPDLPEVNIFVHSHQYALHNERMLEQDAVQMIRRLNSDRVIHEGYVNLRAQLSPGCPLILQNPDERDPAVIALLDFYARLNPTKRTPFALSAPCCAQFAVSRDRLLSIAKEQYISFRDWLIRTKLNNYYSGRVFEYMWHVIFTGMETHCPDEYVSYCDTYGMCFKGAAEIRMVRAMTERMDEIDSKLREVAKGETSAWFGDPEKFREQEAELKAELQDLHTRRETLKSEAIERGKDPKLRAYVGNRKYVEA